MFKSDPGLLPATLRPPAIPSPPPRQGEGEMSTATPPGHPTWAGVVKGKPPPSVPTSPSPPAAHLLQLYRDCVARGTWARLCFETKGGEEELSFSCRVGGAAPSRAATGASKKQGRPANERRRERARRRRRAWEERRRRPAAGGVGAATAATGAASQTGEAFISWSSSHRSSSRRQEKQPLAGTAAVARSSSRYRIFVPVPSSPRQEQHLR